LRSVQDLGWLIDYDLQIIRASIRYHTVHNFIGTKSRTLNHSCQVIPTIKAKSRVGLIVFVQRKRSDVTLAQILAPERVFQR